MLFEYAPVPIVPFRQTMTAPSFMFRAPPERYCRHVTSLMVHHCRAARGALLPRSKRVYDAAEPPYVSALPTAARHAYAPLGAAARDAQTQPSVFESVLCYAAI